MASPSQTISDDGIFHVSNEGALIMRYSETRQVLMIFLIGFLSGCGDEIDGVEKIAFRTEFGSGSGVCHVFPRSDYSHCDYNAKLTPNEVSKLVQKGDIWDLLPFSDVPIYESFIEQSEAFRQVTSPDFRDLCNRLSEEACSLTESYLIPGLVVQSFVPVKTQSAKTVAYSDIFQFIFSDRNVEGEYELVFSTAKLSPGAPTPPNTEILPSGVAECDFGPSEPILWRNSSQIRRYDHIDQSAISSCRTASARNVPEKTELGETRYSVWVDEQSRIVRVVPNVRPTKRPKWDRACETLPLQHDPAVLARNQQCSEERENAICLPYFANSPPSIKFGESLLTGEMPQLLQGPCCRYQSCDHVTISGVIPADVPSGCSCFEKNYRETVFLETYSTFQSIVEKALTTESGTLYDYKLDRAYIDHFVSKGDFEPILDTEPLRYVALGLGHNPASLDKSLTTHELSHPFVIALGRSRPDKWCGEIDGVCPRPIGAAYFHDFADVFGFSFSRSPCFASYHLGDCQSDRNAGLPLDIGKLGGANDDYQKASNYLMWRTLGAARSAEGDDQIMNYWISLVRLIPLFGWAESSFVTTKWLREAGIEIRNEQDDRPGASKDLEDQVRIHGLLLRSLLSISSPEWRTKLNAIYAEAGVEL